MEGLGGLAKTEQGMGPEEQSCLSLSVCLSLHIWCVGGDRAMLCCFVLGSARFPRFGPGYAGVGLDSKCGSAHCCALADEPGFL